MVLGQNLKKHRKKQKLSTEKLADKCSVSRSYITLIENGERMPGKTLIVPLAKALKVKTNVVINWYLEDIRIKLQAKD